MSTLNEAQAEAVRTTEGPVLVIAGAGAGKTRVIAHRILEIVNKGTPPEQILAITFTNKAAKEMRERVLSLLETSMESFSQKSPRGSSVPKRNLAPDFSSRTSHYGFNAPFVSTFHSLGLYILKENAKLLGFKRTPAIYDRSDSLREVKAALKNLNNEEIEPRTALSVISRNKGQGIDAAAFAQSAELPRDRVIAQVWLAYDAALKKDGAVDFDDLLSKPARLLRDNATVREHYQKKWRYIHIDEYQDTNSTQAEMAEMLVGKERNICAVGDIDQTIYGWRGAEIANILSFEKKYPGAAIILLEENYRSTKTILAAANEVIAKNTFRREKNLYTKNGDGEQIRLYQAFDEMDEAGFIARKIKEALRDGKQPRDFCILYRANFQSRAIEEQLLHANINYQVLGTRFFERKEVKDVLSFIKAALYETPADIARIANVPARGIGKVTLLKILNGDEESLTGAVREKVRSFRLLLQKIALAAGEQKPSDLLRYVITESGLEREMKEDKLEGQERLENLRELIALSSRYDIAEAPIDGLQQFLESAALQSDQDEMKDDANAVRLMTVHASKGLEFQHVFITGLEEGLFPYERMDDEHADKEEERRLMYVAITRAQKHLYLTFASYRTVFGSKNATVPSQFLSDISDSLLAWEAPERIGRTIYLD
ncbi:MAG TPA: UvrD-helicase domain-containing protein [Candidatus Paceibacterota bacterium]|nr:UvrD-helicase domain-containing protein [Candidatus Paceibacterota bacterium]